MIATLPLKKYGLLGSLYLSQFMPFWFLYEALPVLLRQRGMSLEAIGLLPLVAIAVSFKFLWSPLIDRYSFARWGHYRFWIIFFQLWIVGITVVCSLLSLDRQLPLILIGLALLGVGCASQDIATDALAVRLLDPAERGTGNAVQGVGGSLGKMIGGGAMLIGLNRWGWRPSLLMLATLMLIALLPVLAYHEPRREAIPSPVKRVENGMGLLAYFKIFLRFCQQPNMGTWLLILGLYAAAHNLSATMFRPLLVDAGLSLSDIGSLFGIVGTSTTILGTLSAGLLITRWGRKRSLLLSSSVALLGIVSYFLPTFGFTQLPVLYGIVSLAFFALGMVGTTAFTIMMDNSRLATAGTDYTLQTSLIALGGILSAAVSGVLANAIGYRGVFGLSVLLLLGCMALVANYFTSAIDPKLKTAPTPRQNQDQTPIKKR
ncbi:MAG: MFS transporter [Cyanobacteria bacterium P01_A01_bin.123]